MCICADYNVPQAKWTGDEFVLCDEGSSASTFNDSASFVNVSQVCKVAYSRSVYLNLVFAHDESIRNGKYGNSIHHTAIELCLSMKKSEPSLAFSNECFDFRREHDSDPQSLWDFINSIKNSSEIRNCMEYKNTSSTDGNVVVDMFADYLSEVFSKDIIVPGKIECDASLSVSGCQFSPRDVLE
ncbi:hypothetical protein HHI36_009981, partial [Cryptolaemus montrouzieri]